MTYEAQGYYRKYDKESLTKIIEEYPGEIADKAKVELKAIEMKELLGGETSKATQEKDGRSREVENLLGGISK